MKTTYLIASTLFVIVLSGCGQPLPECASNEARDLLISMIKKNSSDENSPWNLESKFDIVNTESKTSDKNSCSAKVTFSMPSIADSSETLEEHIDYAVKRNELEKNSYSVEAKVKFKEISLFNMRTNEFIKIAEIKKKREAFSEAAKADGLDNLVAYLNSNSSDARYIDYGPVQSGLLSMGFKNVDTQECNPPSSHQPGGTITTKCIHYFVKDNLKITIVNRAETFKAGDQFVYSWDGEIIK